ncbi:uncharacterized protein LOC129753895 [Uranotaenia lowii]|uniref:uncharacterized protein LOC129753895 n=1 Tax=Uranotaenia lowii TaxID=190385 RepID=UPI00247A5C17|nr:uncharacterized protein LOC129753895 [Uranotaenia lowii]
MSGRWFEIGILMVVLLKLITALQTVESRQKRTLLITEDSATGILAAIAVPLEKEKPHGVDIFASYNFEANYGMTTEATDWTDPWKRFRVDETQNGLAGNTEGGGEGRKIRNAIGSNRTAGMTRRKIYHVIEEHMRVSGLDGKKCLLRAICETAASDGFHWSNGVLGDLVHILLTPSYSMDENLPKEFYKAEMLGSRNKCVKYIKKCPQNVLGLISFEM